MLRTHGLGACRHRLRPSLPPRPLPRPPPPPVPAAFSTHEPHQPENLTPHQALLATAAANGTARAAATAEEQLRRAWVVGDEYLSAWQTPSLAARLQTPPRSPSSLGNLSGPSRAGSPDGEGGKRGEGGDGGDAAPSRAALAALLTPARWERTWAAVQETIEATASVAAVAAAAAAPAAAAAAAAVSGVPGVPGVPEAPFAPGGTFELVRYDFVLDQAASPWLLEVNAWPNMVPTSPGQAAQLRRLCSFLRLRAAAATAATAPAAATDTAAAAAPATAALATDAPGWLAASLSPLLAPSPRGRAT